MHNNFIMVGIYTKKIYDDNTDPSVINECCIWVFKDSIINQEYLNEIWVSEHLKCANCIGRSRCN